MKIVALICILVSWVAARVTSDIMPMDNGTVYEYRTLSNDSLLFVDSLGQWRLDSVVGWDNYTIWDDVKDIVMYRHYGSKIDSNFALWACHKGDSLTYDDHNGVLIYDSLSVGLFVYNSGEFRSEWFTNAKQRGKRFPESFYLSYNDSVISVGNMRHDGAGFDRTMRASANETYHFRSSQKCGAGGKYRMTFVNGIGPIRVDYDSCAVHNPALDTAGQNPTNQAYYLSRIRIGDSVIYKGVKDTVEYKYVSIAQFGSFNQAQIYDTHGRLINTIASNGNLSDVLAGQSLLQGVYFVVVDKGRQRFGFYFKK